MNVRSPGLGSDPSFLVSVSGHDVVRCPPGRPGLNLELFHWTLPWSPGAFVLDRSYVGGLGFRFRLGTRGRFARLRV